MTWQRKYRDEGQRLHHTRCFCCLTSVAEQFTALSSETRVQVGQQAYRVQPGQAAVAPPLALHRWSNPSPHTVTLLVELRPDNTGFERSLEIAYGLARRPAEHARTAHEHRSNGAAD